MKLRSAPPALCLILNLVWAAPVVAQSTAAQAPGPPDAHAHDDAVLNPAEPDFVVINLPTTLRLPRLKGNFRLTHRFAGNLRSGTFGQQASDLFGLDQGAIIGFEYRFAPATHAQAAFYRSSFDKTIQLHGKYDLVQQHGSTVVSISPVVSVEGTNNFQEKFAPAIGAAISRQFGTRFAGYLTPMWVHNTAASVAAITHDHDTDTHSEASGFTPEHRDTTYLGTGARVRLGGTAYVAGEVAVRLQGYAPDQAAYGVSLEKRVGAHMFSLTFTNGFGTTYAQVARGGAANTLVLGFNLGRKFY